MVLASSVIRKLLLGGGWEAEGGGRGCSVFSRSHENTQPPRRPLYLRRGLVAAVSGLIGLTGRSSVRLRAAQVSAEEYFLSGVC